MKKILVVDESQAVRETLGIILGREFSVVQSRFLPADNLSSTNLKADLLFLGAPRGLETRSSELLKIASRLFCPVLFLLDSRSVPALRESQENVDCLPKPFNPYELREKVVRLLARPNAPSTEHLLSSVGKEKAIRYVDFPYVPLSTSQLVKRFVLTSLPVLILAEPGSGQDTVARALYCLKETAGPWIAAYAPEITREGLLGRLGGLSHSGQELPQRFTLYLDNVGALDFSAQSSLLDFLTEEERRGSEIWILSSSKEDLLERVYQGAFLDALYYRLATLTLRLPPLRERESDLVPLAAQVAQEIGERLNLGKVTLSPEAQ
jgi:DNA-binding NtrC family response regulator